VRILFSLGSLLDRLCVVAGAFVCSQIPEFMQQYIQRLSGHVEELHRLLNQLREAATHSNKSLEQYIEKFTSSSDPDFTHQGEFMQGILARWEELHHALLDITHSSIWVRPLAFLKEFQYDIAHSTFASFEPGISLSLEGLCYAAGGILIGWAFYQIASKCVIFGYSRAAAFFKQFLGNRLS
jgi:hypothetical protein